MDISEFTPGNFDADKNEFEQVNIIFTDVTPDEFKDIAAAVKKLTGAQIVAKPEGEEEETLPSSDIPLPQQVKGAVKKLSTATVTGVAKYIYGKNVSKDKKQGVNQVIEKMINQGEIEKKKYKNATIYKPINRDT